LTVNLTNLEGVDADVIMMLIQQANRELSAWGDKIFGRMDEATHSVKQLRIPRDMGQAGAAEYAAVGDKAEDTKIYSKLLAKKYEDGKLSVEEEAELERVMEGSTGIRDGELGAHIGFAPKFKEGGSLDLEKSRSSNVEYAGAGEMGLIMLDFQWNAMMNSKGYTELAKPMYDQKMWAGDMLGMEPPTLRSITDMAVTIAVSIAAGIATAGAGSLLVMSIASAAAGLVDDVVFSGIDLAGGYKSPGEVGVELGKKVAIAAASVGVNAGFDQLGEILSKTFGDSMALTAGLAGTKTLTTSTINSTVSAVQFDGSGLTWNREVFDAGYGVGMIASVVGSAVSAGVGSALGSMDAADSKFLSGAVKLGTAAAGKTAEYATYAAYSLAEGGTLLDAYDNMGGLTINVANLGAILDFAGSVMARGNKDNQSIFGDGKVLQNLSGIGLLEVNFGSDGISTAIGMGGIDVGGALYEQVKRGIDYAGLKSYMKEEQDSWKADMAWKTYVYGDFTQENTAMRLAGGLDELRFEEEIKNAKGEMAAALTTSQGNGRLIQMMDSGNADVNAVRLGHESYRDGIIGSGQTEETLDAVIAHTKMADKMYRNGADFGGDENIMRDLYEFYKASASGNMSAFTKYAMDSYDSSADFWKLVRREDGSYGVLRDGNHSLLDENGNVIVRSPLDEFDKDGKIIGHKIETENSYKRSFGMLMGLYPDFIQNGQTYAEYDAYVDAELKKINQDNDSTDASLRAVIDKAMAETAADGSIDVNSYLMTYKDVISGKGVFKTTIRTQNDASYSLAFVDIKNKNDEIVGRICTSFMLSSNRNSEVDYVMIENMIPEGQRLKAATFQFDSTGNVEMYGMGSTMPDPNKMGQPIPKDTGKTFAALADGTYRQVTSLHNLDGASYKALRLFDAVTGAAAKMADVTGPKRKDATAVPGFPYTEKDNWGTFRGNLPGYYYDEKEGKVDETVFSINAHRSNNFPSTGVIKDGKYTVSIGGSDGCQIWYPMVYEQLMRNQKYGTFGNFIINRSLFGDGTKGQNNYLDW
jgi:hypothetical protein